ncbi:TIGR03118 family protein [Kribbella sp. NPDC051770]|uniref:TIGR03118 family protein n=1 Tax=Kribbella sp. NPDC051770 TaxID=3155413 RepID=UPI00341E8D33
MSLRRPRRFARTGTIALATAVTAGLAVIAPTTASAHHPSRDRLAVQQVNLVSDLPGKAALHDPDLVNPWGLALGATSPLWVSNAGTSSSTLYSSAPAATTATKVPTVRVDVPAPSGQVANAGTNFVLTDGTASAPARFIFATLTGSIAAWGPPVTPLIGAAQIKATTPGAAYSGLAISPTNDRLYAANFAQNRVDVFGPTFARVKTPWWSFKDLGIPRGFAPFNVQTLGSRVFVTYAKVDPKTGRSINHRGDGYVTEFTPDGRYVTRIASRGNLNAPWGVAFAPASWGSLAGSLLIGNFGDGRVNVLTPKPHHRYTYTGQLKTTHGKTLVIPGLWALTQGTATTGGTDALWFSAGIANETHGLLGVLRHP